MRITQLLAVTAVVAGSIAATSASAGDTQRLKTRLVGPAIGDITPSGAAEFRERDTARRFTAEVEDVRLPNGTPLRVCVNGSDLGVVALAGGFADLNRDTRDGEIVPDMQAGDQVTVRHGSTGCGDGTVILSGSL